MHILTKSLIGLVTTGTIAVGGYYGSNALNKKTLGPWEKENATWFKEKWKPFYSKIFKQGGDQELFAQWQKWKTNQNLDKESLSEFQISRKFKEWCDSNSKEANFPKVQEGCK